ncbi:papain-like cysteine protease family protein [Azospirillum sp. HJ39]|uniref:papain-like cysteine protease family protein n=1 Tax=Azospirillum sp. HJ39 TaxID=3159496 RepID=UPI003558644B
MRLIIEPAKAQGTSWDPLAMAGGGLCLLPLQVERQRRSNWCWAAIAAAVASWYGHERRWTQEEIAATMGQGGTGDDREELLGNVLAMVDCFSHWSPGRPTIARLAAEIGAGRPVGIRIARASGAGHYVLVSGCDPQTGELMIDDPLTGPCLYRFCEFPRREDGRGSVWAETIWTRPPAIRQSARR